MPLCSMRAIFAARLYAMLDWLDLPTPAVQAVHQLWPQYQQARQHFIIDLRKLHTTHGLNVQVQGSACRLPDAPYEFPLLQLTQVAFQFRSEHDVCYNARLCFPVGSL